MRGIIRFFVRLKYNFKLNTDSLKCICESFFLFNKESNKIIKHVLQHAKYGRINQYVYIWTFHILLYLGNIYNVHIW